MSPLKTCLWIHSPVICCLNAFNLFFCSCWEAPAHANESGSGDSQSRHRCSCRDLQLAVREVVHSCVTYSIQLWHQQATAVQVQTWNDIQTLFIYLFENKSDLFGIFAVVSCYRWRRTASMVFMTHWSNVPSSLNQLEVLAWQSAVSEQPAAISLGWGQGHVSGTEIR